MTYLRSSNIPFGKAQIENLKRLNFQETVTFKAEQKKEFDSYISNLRSNNKRPAVDFAYLELEVEIKENRKVTVQKVYKVFEK